MQLYNCSYKGTYTKLPSFEPGLIIKLEQRQVEGPQCDGEIFLFSSAKTCRSSCWAFHSCLLSPPSIFISSSILPSFPPTFLLFHISSVLLHLKKKKKILPTSFLALSISLIVPLCTASSFGLDLCFFHPQIWIKPKDCTINLKK